MQLPAPKTYGLGRTVSILYESAASKKNEENTMIFGETMMIVVYLVLSVIILAIIVLRKFSWYWTILGFCAVIALLFGIEPLSIVNNVIGPGASIYSLEIPGLLIGTIFFSILGFLGIPRILSTRIKTNSTSSRIALITVSTLVMLGLLLAIPNIGTFYVVTSMLLPLLVFNGISRINQKYNYL